MDSTLQRVRSVYAATARLLFFLYLVVCTFVRFSRIGYVT